MNAQRKVLQHEFMEETEAQGSADKIEDGKQKMDVLQFRTQD
jgi:hypothetical protein